MPLAVFKLFFFVKKVIHYTMTQMCVYNEREHAFVSTQCE